MLIDCDVLGLGSVKSFIAGPRFHKGSAAESLAKGTNVAFRR